jgi:hypothetical protein
VPSDSGTDAGTDQELPERDVLSVSTSAPAVLDPL